MSLRPVQHLWPAGKAAANGSAFQPEVKDSLLGTETVDLVSDLAGLAFYKDAVPDIGDQCKLFGKKDRRRAIGSVLTIWNEEHSYLHGANSLPLA